MRGALQIIERLEEETVDLSEVSIGSKGVRIGERFVSKADIENFDQSLEQINSAYSPTVAVIDRVSRENIETPTLPRPFKVRPNPTAETPPKARSALENLGQFFKALRWPTLLVKIAEIFEKMKIALNWESYTLELNQLYRNNGYDPAKVMAVLDEPHRDHANELKHLFQMQQNVLQHLLTVSLPITGISTGMIGLKYGKGMKENLLPLYCIPPVVKNESGEIIQLLRYKRSGRPKGLTTEGHRLITQLSLHRGA